MAEQESLTFTLVHGTFAKGAAWVTHTDSAFRTRLETALRGYTVNFDDAFSWGHDGWWRFRDNSETARANGAEQLQTHLLSTPRPVGKHFIIAHSHAGNIALQAIRDGKVCKAVDGVVCLATPFLFARPRKLPKSLLFLSVLALVILASLLFQRPDFLPALRGALMVLAGLYGLVIVTVILELFRKTPANAVQEHDFGPSKPRHLFLIRPSGDEASGLLRTSQFVTWILGKLLDWLDAIVGLLVTVLLISRFGYKGLHWVAEQVGKQQEFQKFADLHLAWLEWDPDPVFGTILVMASLLVVLMAMQWLAVSFDRIGRFANVEMLTEDSPPGIESEVLVLPPETTANRTLVHTQIYNRPEAAQAIADWVRRM